MEFDQPKTGQKMKNLDKNFKKKWKRFFPLSSNLISLPHFVLHKSLYIYFILFLTKMFVYKIALHTEKVIYPRLHG